MLSVKASRALFGALIGAVLGFLVASPRPAFSQSIDRQELSSLIESYNRWAAGIRTVRAGGKARVGGEGETTRAFDYSLLLARPGQARIQGRLGVLATVFDLSGDPDGWVLYVPQDALVVEVEGASERAGLLLPPMELLAVLLPLGIPPRDVLDRGTATREGDSIRVVVPPGQGGAGSSKHRVLWLDPENGTPSRLELREKSQLESPTLIAVYGGYEGSGTKAFPAEVRVDVPADGSWARFTFETVRINGDVDPAAFQLRVPAGTRRIQPEELTPDFLPEAEESD
jgi:hypothetical protein